MVNCIKEHWLCFMVGGVVGWCLHLCPLFDFGASQCPVAGQECERHAVCACDDCVCDVCVCDGDGCGCPNCVKE